jgi:hypothetical protein
VAKGIGAAEDYYRLRVMRVDDTNEPDLEWREDILYRRPPAQHVDEAERYRVEAVTIAAEDEVTVLGSFDSPEEAYEALAAAEEDLAELTRSEFEGRYFPADA